ncbi:hypothetical protein EVAR_16213_1 [Eumeta japonica]|uniref:Uncharacterized protein n=1 Tax=Eumeta variegata TaxID=151549 RepID=A0A4C1U6E1_EUMVA|nr:hypothetical protein EVAR_16213_1 [Eumeta japonica]
MANGINPMNHSITAISSESANRVEWTECLLKCAVRWLSCNGEPWGLGPTAVVASAAALCIYNELEAALADTPPPRPQLAPLERALLVSVS